jgi:energy-coupling factor transporter ATP-binding protein EcfA2
MGGGVDDFNKDPDRAYNLQQKEEELKKAKEEVEKAAQAQKEAEKREREAKEKEKKAREEQEEAEEKRRQAKMRAEEAERRVQEAQRKMEEHRRKAEADAKQAEERVAEAQRKARAEREEAEAQASKARQRAAEAEQERRDAEAEAAEAQRKAAEAMQRAEEEAARTREALEQAQAERQKREAQVKEAASEREKLQSLIESLSAGIEPEFIPTEEERAQAEKRFQYKKENIHFAVAGSTGTGKSSLINAFRGLRDVDEGAAKVDIAEATLETHRYPDLDPELPRRRFIWYDIPGSDGVEIDAWEYFKKQQLFVFDVVLVVFSERFKGSDIVLLRHCERLDIPTFIVRSKSDLAIESIQKKLFEAAMQLHDLEDEEDEDEDNDEDGGKGKGKDVDENDGFVNIHNRDSPQDYYQKAREQYISTATENVRAALAKEGLPDKPVYLVMNEGILLVSKYMGKKPMSKLKGLVNRQKAKKLLDEEKLVRDILQAAYNRRYSAKAPATTIPADELSGVGGSSGSDSRQ